MKISYVDKNDNVIGSAEIGDAYKQGLIARIARVFLVNNAGEILIQRRSANMHLPNRWDQSAAGHVDEGESYLEAAKRELKEEVGVSGVALKPLSKFYSEENDEKDLIKKRFNTIYAGAYNGEVVIDEAEVSSYQWIKPEELNDWIKNTPADFTDGFINAYKEYLNTI